MKIDKNQWKWTRKPQSFLILDDKIEIITVPYTDMWQGIYCYFKNDMVMAYFRALGKLSNSIIITIRRNIVWFIMGVIVLNCFFQLNGAILM
ncbi:MAG: hypothetical protein ACI4F9_11095 [Lachnospiraceae bacterium]